MVFQRKHETNEEFILRRKKYNQDKRLGISALPKDSKNFWPSGRPKRKWPWCNECGKTVMKKDWAKYTTLGMPMKIAKCGTCRSQLTWSLQKGG
jgi:hypothetical protein